MIELLIRLWTTGAIFGPALTKWYQLLNRIKFPNPTKAVVYRVGIFPSPSKLRSVE